MRVGILGGSFDPVHKGHLKLAAAARRQLRLDTVYLLLTPRSPFKTKNKISPLPRRLKWLGSSLKGYRGLKVGTWELKRKGPVYTVQSLRDYKKRRPSDSIFFIMGSDSWKGFSKWRKPHEIAALSTLVVGRRPGTPRVPVPRKFKDRVRVLRGVFPDVSSTHIRKLTKRGMKIPTSLVPAAVSKDLYGYR